MTRLPRNKCRHLEGSLLMHRDVGFYTMWTNVCALCGELLSMGDSDEQPVAVEVRAAEIAADASDGFGLGGHRPEHCTGEHCWHWSADEDDGPCCYCGHVYEDETVCDAGYLARCIATHDAQQAEQGRKARMRDEGSEERLPRLLVDGTPYALGHA